MASRHATPKTAVRRLGRLADEVRQEELASANPMPIASGLMVGAANDPAEADADRLADRALQRLALATGSGPGADAHRHGPDCSHVQRRAAPGGVIGLAGGTLDEPSSGAIEGERGRGSALPSQTRTRLEGAFDADFSAVRVHAGSQAADLNRSVSARAFTTGSDIFFGAGEYSPDTAEGERTLAHELGHVVQQGPAAGRRSVRRLMTLKSKDINRVRSTKGAVKGLLTRDTLYRLGSVLDDFDSTKDPKKRLIMVDVILGLCQTYITNHGTVEEDKAKVALVEDIFAQAQRERSQAQAQAQYLGDAKGTSAPGGVSKDVDTHLKGQKGKTKPSVHGGSALLGAGKTFKPTGAAGEVPIAGADSASLAVVKKYGLTEAEILAVKIYTADDYTYINPATANNAGWMAATNLSDWDKKKATKDPTKPENDTKADTYAAENAERLKGLKAEGSLHAGVAMMALAKLPVKKGKTYRGARGTQAEFDDWYGTKATYRFDAFASTAVTQTPAVNFSKGGPKTKPEQTISIMCELMVNNARDVRNLSIFGSSEQEWLLLPGAEFSIDSVKELPTGEAGSPKATKWYVVKLTQTK